VPQFDNGPVEGYKPGDDPGDMQMSYPDAANLLKSGQGERRTAMYGVPASIEPPRKDIPAFSATGLAPTRDFFAMFKVPFLHGQAWSEADDARGADVVVLGRETAEKLYGDANPVGKR
jgi:putative ABC transport system permease protein